MRPLTLRCALSTIASRGARYDSEHVAGNERRSRRCARRAAPRRERECRGALAHEAERGARVVRADGEGVRGEVCAVRCVSGEVGDRVHRGRRRAQRGAAVARVRVHAAAARVWVAAPSAVRRPVASCGITLPWVSKAARVLRKEGEVKSCTCRRLRCRLLRSSRTSTPVAGGVARVDCRHRSRRRIPCIRRGRPQYGRKRSRGSCTAR